MNATPSPILSSLAEGIKETLTPSHVTEAAPPPRRRRPSQKTLDTKLGAAIGAVMDAPLVRKRRRPKFKRRALPAATRTKKSIPIPPQPETRR